MSRLMKIRNDPRVVPDNLRYRLMAFDFRKGQKKSFPTRIQATGKTAPPKDPSDKNNKSGMSNGKDRLWNTERRRTGQTQSRAVNRRKKNQVRNVRGGTQTVRNNGRARNTHPSKGKIICTGKQKVRRTTKREGKKSRVGKGKTTQRVKKTRTDERRGPASKRAIRCSKCHRTY